MKNKIFALCLILFFSVSYLAASVYGATAQQDNTNAQNEEALLEQKCIQMLKKIDAYKANTKNTSVDDYIFYSYDYNTSENRYVIGQSARHYRNYYYFSKNGQYEGIITMRLSDKNKSDVVFTSKNPKGKVYYTFIADYYLVMSSRKVMFSLEHAKVYFPGGKYVTINTGETGKLNNNGTFKLKNGTFLPFITVKKYNAYGQRML